MRAAVEAEAGVLALLPHRPHVADPRRGDQQAHPGVAHPERGQPPQLLGEIEAEAGAADHRVDPLGPPQVLRPEHLCGVGGERLAEGVDALGPSSSPAAARCPPNEVRCSAQASSPASRSKPGMLRPEPRPPPSPSSEITIAGR